MKTLIVLALLLTGCAHAKVDSPKTADMGGVKACGPDDCGKPAVWETI